MVVEEDNSSPMTQITSRTELDVIEEAENEPMEREDEWIRSLKEKARVEYCTHVFLSFGDGEDVDICSCTVS